MKLLQKAFLLIALVLLCGVSHAQDGKQGWQIELKKIALDVTSTEVKHAKEYQDFSDARLNGDSQTAVRGNLDAISDYHAEHYLWTNELLMDYGRTKIRPVEGETLTNENADKILPFAGIVLTAGSVLRADDAAGPVLSKKMEDAPLAGWYTIDGGQTPEDDIIEVKRERPPRLVLVDAADMALPVGSIRLLDKRDVARKSMFTTHSLPLSILIEEIEQSCEDIVFIGIQPGDTEFYNPMSPEVFDAVDAVYDAVVANDFSHFVRLGQEQ